MNQHFVRSQLSEKRLKVTPQRVAVFEALLRLKHHPTAENIIDYIKKNHPNISVGTVYKILELLVEKQLIRKVKTESGIMRYDAIMHRHHHLYCEDTDRIEDFEDPELDRLISDYFKRKKIKGFRIKDITLQITGTFS
ncbi:MAG: transcriptional repressor [Chitinophagaceae bacterium]|nr:transcriptional repressor [Chitinophagaceae bacterium]